MQLPERILVLNKNLSKYIFFFVKSLFSVHVQGWAGIKKFGYPRITDKYRRILFSRIILPVLKKKNTG